MDHEPHRSALPRSPLPSWVLILLTAPVLFGAVIYASYLWHERLHGHKEETAQISKQFIQRQNTILAYDAVAISRQVSELFEMVVRDVQTFSLIPAKPESWLAFYESHSAQISEYDASKHALNHVSIPIYSELIKLNSSGNEVLRFRTGRITRNRVLAECTEKKLCGRKFLEEILRQSKGKVYIGRLLRWYSKEGEPEDNVDAMIPIGYHLGSHIYVLSLDYRHLMEILYPPSFPYREKKKLIEAYQDGNYIYIVDDLRNIIAHPKYWNVFGIDKSTGKWIEPMRTDQQDGQHPINISAYQGEKLRDYFKRLLNVSFVQEGVDVFQASNLRGVIRVLSVAPIRLALAQYKETGIFGHVVAGCHVDYFEEPKEKLIPYY